MQYLVWNSSVSLASLDLKRLENINYTPFRPSKWIQSENSNLNAQDKILKLRTNPWNCRFGAFLVFSNKFAYLWLYHLYYCICIILNLFMIFVYTNDTEMRTTHKGTIVYIKQLIIINLFFATPLKICLWKTIW